MHGLDFCEYLPTADVPVLATIHLPRRWLADDTFTISRPKTYLQPGSRAQRIECGSLDLLPEIENGVAIERFALHRRKRGFALALSRICPEKGLHLALDAAKEANVALLLGGRIFPYREHEDYFDREIAPRLDARRRFLGPLGLARKRRLLGAARCLLVPSLAPETSSLVAMEALASGTPVVAFPSGALPEIVEDGVTGFLVRNTSEMAEAIHRSAELDPEACRLAARRRFSSTVMVERYLALYQRLIDSGAHDRRDPMSAGAGGAWT
jgi:glycosyltransferase involved in cell wall biosynthesis